MVTTGLDEDQRFPDRWRTPGRSPQVYVAYLGGVLDGYREAGAPLDAITPQNEPLNGETGDYPGAEMAPEQQAEFVRVLVSRFEADGHSADTRLRPQLEAARQRRRRPHYPATLMSEAHDVLAGTAYHCYAGRPEEQAELHEAFPARARCGAARPTTPSGTPAGS